MFIYPIVADPRWWLSVLLFLLLWIGGPRWIHKITGRPSVRYWPLAIGSIVLLVAIFLLHGPILTTGNPESVSRSVSTAAPKPLNQSIYVSDIKVDFTHVTTDGDLVFTITLFNGSGTAVVITKFTEGLIHWGINTINVSFSDPPQIDSKAQLTVFYPAEFRFAFKQHVSPVIGDRIFKAFSTDQPVEFGFGDVKIGVTTERFRTPEARLSLWDGVLCRKATPTDIVYSHIVSPTSLAIEARPGIEVGLGKH